jgi:hypothetical protein
VPLTIAVTNAFVIASISLSCFYRRSSKYSGKHHTS